MPKRPLIDVHEWVSFDDEEEDRTWVWDVTFLTSNWTCLFGNGCPGIGEEPAPEREEGCCSFGAHFTDDADRSRPASRSAGPASGSCSRGPLGGRPSTSTRRERPSAGSSTAPASS
jgi:hypothetical protein